MPASFIYFAGIIFTLSPMFFVKILSFTYSVSGSSVDSSFSTLDQKGTYKATLYLTNAAPAAAL